MAKQNLGRVIPVFKGDYDNSLPYEHLDVVVYYGSTYIAINDTINQIPTNEDFWALLVKRPIKGIDYFTEEEIGQIVADITEKANSLFNQNVDGQTNTFNENVNKKMTEFNDDFANKTNLLNENVINQINSIDSHVEDKITSIDTHVVGQTTTFDNHVSDKIAEMKTNAQNLLNDYDENANNKMQELNENADNKIQEFNENVDDLKVELDDLKNNALKGSVENTSINLQDSADSRIVGFELKGCMKQDAKYGYNLLPYENKVFTPNSVTWFFLDGTSGAFGNTIGEKTEIKVPVESGKTYTIYVEEISNIATMQLVKEDESMIKTNVYAGYSTFTADFDGYVILRIRNSKENIETYVKNVMIYEGTEEKKYEQYTGGQPSPNPDYPQNIDVVTGNVEVKCTNNNLLKIIAYGGNNGITSFVNEDKSIYFKGTPTLNYARLSENNNIEIPSGKYIFSISEPLNFATVALKTNYKEKGICDFTIPKNERTINVDFIDDVVSLYVFIHNLTIGQEVSGTIFPMLRAINIEDNANETYTGGYVEHQSQTYSLSLGNIELCGNNQARDYIDGKIDDWYLNNKWEKIIFDGNEDWKNFDTSGGFFRYSADRLLNYIQSDTTGYIYGMNNYFMQRNEQNHGDYEYLYFQKTEKTAKNVTYIQSEKFSTVDELKNWLQDKYVSGKPLIGYYELEKSTKTKITDKVLINQLNAIYKARTYKNITNVYSTSNNLNPIIRLDYYKDLETIVNNMQAMIISNAGEEV